jgi:hypothetical protein
MLVLAKINRYIVYHNKNAILKTLINNLEVGIGKEVGPQELDSTDIEIEIYYCMGCMHLRPYKSKKYLPKQIDSITVVYKIIHPVYKSIYFTISWYDNKWYMVGRFLYFYKTPIIIDGIYKFWFAIKN